MQEISIEIKIKCPVSVEFNDFVNSIPSDNGTASTFEEWKSSFVENMTQLIRLVESEKIGNAMWSVKADKMEE